MTNKLICKDWNLFDDFKVDILLAFFPYMLSSFKGPKVEYCCCCMIKSRSTNQ